MIGAVSRAITPNWVLSNTAGGRDTADAIAANSAGVIEEFLLRPLDASWSDVGDVSGLVAQRLAALPDVATAPSRMEIALMISPILNGLRIPTRQSSPCRLPPTACISPPAST